jgi:hypothetical protein
MEPHLSASVTPLEASQIAAENIVSQLVFFAMLQDPAAVSDPLSPIQLTLEGLNKSDDFAAETVLLLATSRMEAAEA